MDRGRGRKESNAENSCYCQRGTQVYIFNYAMFESEEYLVYSLLTNSWEVLRFPTDVNPSFVVDSKLAVGVGRQIYLFLISSANGEISFKVLNMRGK